MSDEVTPMYPTLFSQVQDYVVERLNSDYQLSAVGLEFIPEHIRDVEYLIKRNLGKQGMVGIVNTVKAQYGGHDGETQCWQMEVECDILENPPIRKAWMKKNDLSAGTVVDCCNFVNESLAGPYSPTYGQFCSKSVEVGEDSGIVVGKCLFDTYALGEISGAISGESHYVIKWATKDELSALSAETWAAIEELSAELSGSEEVWNAISALNINKRDYIDLTLDCTGCLEDRPNDYDHSPLHEDLPHCGIDSFNLEWTYPDEQRGLASMFVYYPEGEYNHRQKEWHTFDNLMPFEVWYIKPELTALDRRWKFHLKSGSYPTWETILEFTPEEIAEAGDEGLPVTITEAGSEYDARLKVKYANSPIATTMTVDEKIENRIGLALRGINY